ncbi:MAG: fasciclin domain-containing protein [Prevotella sp.]|jgi:hypothetical protein
MKKIKIHRILFLTVLVVAFVSCSDWDDHYSENSQSTDKGNLYEILSQNSNTSVFVSMLQEVGYDEVLSSTQTYTVFAPTNDALADVDLSNQALVKRIVLNHIARYSQPTSTDTTQGVKMLNGKIYYYDNSTSFSGSAILDANESASNGLVQVLGSQIPYAYNIYEYIQNNAQFSKLYNFIHQFDEVIFDQDNSEEIDVDDQGRPVYDSIMISYNRLLDHSLYGIGQIENEDSVYTMLLPNDTAWDAAYERIAPSFVCYDEDQTVADSLQDIRTCQAIVGDLIYRGSHPQPDAEDSLTSTTNSVIHNPADLFAGADITKASNGYYASTDSLRYDNVETWNKEISVEAEVQEGRTYNNTLTTVYTRNVTSASLVSGVSEDSYIEVMPISASTNPVVIFDIPNVLAGAYNIYAVFLPTTVTGETEDLDSTRIAFSLSYLNASGRQMTRNVRSSSNPNFITSGTEIVKMPVLENFTFPVCNTTDRLWLMDENNDESDVEVTTHLTVQTNVTAREFSSGKYSRSFRLDRIIFEPVKK